jgi:hypothetical protein
MQLKEYLREGIKPFEKILFQSVIDFCIDKFKIKAKIKLKSKPIKKTFGDISLNKDSINNSNFTVHYNNKSGYKFNISALIHELVHVKQVVKKELGISDDYKQITWKGKEIISVSEYNKLVYQEYSDLPFEKEAIIKSETMKNEYLNSKFFKGLKGKDNTLDIIIDNL